MSKSLSIKGLLLSKADNILIEKCKRGDTNSFEILVLKYQRRIFNLIFRLTNEPDIVEDIAQEVFLRAYNAINDFKGKSSFSTWIYRITVNTCFNYIKSKRRHQYENLETNEPLEKYTLTSNNLTDTELLIERHELSKKIKEAIGSLNHEQRTIFVLRDVEGLSYEEIGKILDCPSGTVRSRLFRARRELRTKLENYIKV